MDISITFENKVSIINKIFHHITLFHSFEKIYLFGSILNRKKIPNDIDLLLIYDVFSSNILVELDEIESIFVDKYGFKFDLIVLSKVELKETNFIERLNSKYLKLK